ncbi:MULTISPECIES: hypothetical protein [unclassified Streptomyces]
MGKQIDGEPYTAVEIGVVAVTMAGSLHAPTAIVTRLQAAEGR